ncbi:hypothetical protein GCM10022291_30020 [Postechiella marina]|uniref:Uncharacterized protein n=1 Tax=Postechiella marina TaxID=943941 RepID=A0ABP8CFH9_9FLAO
MKTKNVILLSGLVISLFVFSGFKADTLLRNEVAIVNQEVFTVTAIYDGKEDYGYNFLIKDKDGDERTLTCHEVEETVLKAFNLNSEALIGTKFKVTYTQVVKVSQDEDGNEDEDEINTITKLEKL